MYTEAQCGLVGVLTETAGGGEAGGVTVQQSPERPTAWRGCMGGAVCRGLKKAHLGEEVRGWEGRLGPIAQAHIFKPDIDPCTGSECMGGAQTPTSVLEPLDE